MVSQQEIYNSLVIEKIEERFFDRYPQVVHDRDLIGQLVQDGKIFLGSNNGDPSYLLHEMAHLAEIDKERVFCNGWGLKYGTEYQINYDKVIYEPKTPQHFFREMRVWSYQLSLNRHFNYLENVKELCSPLTIMSNLFLLDKYVLEITDTTRQCEKDKLYVAWAARNVEVGSCIFTFERFCQQWDEKLVKN